MPYSKSLQNSSIGPTTQGYRELHATTWKIVDGSMCYGHCQLLLITWLLLNYSTFITPFITMVIAIYLPDTLIVVTTSISIHTRQLDPPCSVVTRVWDPCIGVASWNTVESLKHTANYLPQHDVHAQTSTPATNWCCAVEPLKRRRTLRCILPATLLTVGFQCCQSIESLKHTLTGAYPQTPTNGCRPVECQVVEPLTPTSSLPTVASAQSTVPSLGPIKRCHVESLNQLITLAVGVSEFESDDRHTWESEASELSTKPSFHYTHKANTVTVTDSCGKALVEVPKPPVVQASCWLAKSFYCIAVELSH